MYGGFGFRTSGPVIIRDAAKVDDVVGVVVFVDDVVVFVVDADTAGIDDGAMQYCGSEQHKCDGSYGSGGTGRCCDAHRYTVQFLHDDRFGIFFGRERKFFLSMLIDI